MCGDTAFVLFYPGGQRRLDDIDIIEAGEEGLRLVDLKGNESTIPGQIRTIDLLNRRIEVVE